MDNKVLQFIVSLFFPPLAVFIKYGKLDNAVWINVVLTILGGVPGVLHAWYEIFFKK